MLSEREDPTPPSASAGKTSSSSGGGGEGEGSEGHSSNSNSNGGSATPSGPVPASAPTTIKEETRSPELKTLPPAEDEEKGKGKGKRGDDDADPSGAGEGPTAAQMDLIESECVQVMQGVIALQGGVLSRDLWGLHAVSDTQTGGRQTTPDDMFFLFALFFSWAGHKRR